MQNLAALLFYVSMKLDVKQQFNKWSNSSDFYLGGDPFECLLGMDYLRFISVFLSYYRRMPEKYNTTATLNIIYNLLFRVIQLFDIIQFELLIAFLN